MKNNLLRKTVLFLGISVLLLSIGWHAHSWHLRSTGMKGRRVKAAGYRFTSPLLDVELPEGVNIMSDPLPFKHKVADFVKQMTDGAQARSISVYFRDLGDGPWFGINEHQEYNPASMMKVPVMIAWLKRAEKNPQVLKQTFLFDGTVDMSRIQLHKPRFTLTTGHSYPVEKLLEYMITYSDNNALSLLYYHLTKEELNAVAAGMDISYQSNGTYNSITAHGYSGFFRILFNASFLNREMSEKALQLLSYEDFPEGISAGVPKGVPVAGKFGEFGGGSSGEEQQLHEFAIVYHPKGAYILGIMTRGNDFARQTNIIRDISALIYREVDSPANR